MIEGDLEANQCITNLVIEVKRGVGYDFDRF